MRPGRAVRRTARRMPWIARVSSAAASTAPTVLMVAREISVGRLRHSWCGSVPHPGCAVPCALSPQPPRYAAETKPRSPALCATAAATAARDTHTGLGLNAVSTAAVSAPPHTNAADHQTVSIRRASSVSRGSGDSAPPGKSVQRMPAVASSPPAMPARATPRKVTPSWCMRVRVRVRRVTSPKTRGSWTSTGNAQSIVPVMAQPSPLTGESRY
ncbi:hypothetical protein GCM10020256_01840 [Streptomyces thermocoprophilus]